MEALTQKAAGQLLHIFLLGIGSTPKEAKIGLDTKILLGYNWAKKKSQDTHGWEALRALTGKKLITALSPFLAAFLVNTGERQWPCPYKDSLLGQNIISHRTLVCIKG